MSGKQWGNQRFRRGKRCVIAQYSLPADGIHGTFGVIVVLVLLAALSYLIFWRSRATKVDHKNVNAEWTGTVAPAEVPAETAAA